MATASGTWKAFEREIANYFDCYRTPLSGMCASLTKADIMHGEVFVEAKYRDNFAIFPHYRAKQKEALKAFQIARKARLQSRFPVPIFRISNFKKYQEDLWLFDHEYLPLLGDLAVMVGESDEGKERVTYMSSGINVIEGFKADTLVNLYKEVAEKSAEENKLPMVAIKMKNQAGWLVVVQPKLIPSISKHIAKAENTV